MRRPHAAAAAVLLLWVAVLTVVFHGLGFGSSVKPGSVPSVSFPRKVLLAVTTFDASPSAGGDHRPRHHHRHHHHHDQHHHGRHGHHEHWNRQGIPPSAAGKGEEVDPRYGVQKRLVPTGPNPLHH